MCNSEAVFSARSTAVHAASFASSEPSVAKRILVGKMFIVRLLARGSAHEHMMPVGGLQRTRYAPVSSNTGELEPHLASILPRLQKVLTCPEYIEYWQDDAADGLRERRTVVPIMFLTRVDDNPCEQRPT